MSDKAEIFEKWFASFQIEHDAEEIITRRETALEAFGAGWAASENQPCNTVEAPKIQHILSRDQRDALVAANVFLSVLQDDRTELFNRIQGIVDEISDILYG